MIDMYTITAIRLHARPHEKPSFSVALRVALLPVVHMRPKLRTAVLEPKYDPYCVHVHMHAWDNATAELSHLGELPRHVLLNGQPI